MTRSSVTLIAAVAGAVAGCIAALVVANAAAPPPRSDVARSGARPTVASAANDAALDAVRGGLAEVATEIRELRKQLAAATPAPVRPPAASEAEVRADGERDASRDEVVKPSGLSSPPALAGRLATLAQWDADEELRRRWMFAADEEVLAWFGTPTRVEPYDWGEHWIYRADSEAPEVRLILRHGRVVKVQAERAR